MSKPELDPGKITRPTQLAATWFAAMIILVTTFLGAATLITSPRWVAPVLVIVASLIVGFFGRAIFLLQTKYRRELQEDRSYSRSMAVTEPIQAQAAQLRRILRDAGLDIRGLSRGRSLDDKSLELQEHVAELSSIVQHQIAALKVGSSPEVDSIRAEAEFSVAKALMAEGRWSKAAEHFGNYLKGRPDDWEGYFSLGYCHGKSRLGQVSDAASLQAYEKAYALAPANLEPNIRARLLVYRAAIKKRLGRLDEAERELIRGRDLATESEERQDAQYHLASIYAMTDRHEMAIDLVRELRNTPYIASIWSHLGDYFHGIADLPAFREALGQPPGYPDDPEHAARLLRLRAAR
jgi:tetratricopeptide (TPR) repeat protein